MRKMLLPIIAAVLLALPGAAGAQQAPADKDKVELDIKEAIGAVEDEYIGTSFQNLSKLYWAIGKMDLDNDAHIDDYLRIHECEMFVRYFNNEFEWQGIRKATRELIMQQMPEFPTQFEVVVPISLGPYDIEEGKFELTEESKVINSKKLDYQVNWLRGLLCGKPYRDMDYPANLILLLSKPLSIISFPVKREMAELYLQETKARFAELPPKLQLSMYERLAYLRLKVRITQYKETTSGGYSGARAVVFAMLDGYEIYADPDKLILLYKKNFKGPRRSRRAISKIEMKDIEAEEPAEETEGTPKTPEAPVDGGGPPVP